MPVLSKAQSLDDLSRLSIDDLANVEITSVSKTAESLSDAPAAIYVISHDDIIRSGASTIPEMLRLAPNLQVAQITSSSYAITARGFNGATTSNGAGNKLLVLIDGRTVYTPLYGGVFWDLQYVPPNDIDRIEVISGPGATLWGSNAVNGVINVITKNSADTQGAVLDAGAGNLQRSGSGEYGGKIGGDATYRLYAEGTGFSSDNTGTGAEAHDNWQKSQGGFRFDWKPSGDLVTFQGDLFGGTEAQASPPDANISGQNLLGRWTHQTAGGSNLQVQGYYDNNSILVPNSLGDVLDTYDVDAQDSFSLGSRNDLVMGGGYRLAQDHFINTATVLFLPSRRTLDLSNIFLQDNIGVTDTVKLDLGAKLEDDPFVGIQPLPSVHMSWKPDSTNLFWSGISRAVRAPTLWDRDLNEKTGGGVTALTGGNFQSEKLTAYELGYRSQPFSQLSLSLSTYYNVYDDLRSIEFSPGPALPLTFENLMEGDTYGAEFWATWGVTGTWRLSPGFNILHENLRFKPGSSQVGGLQEAGNDPPYQFSLRSSWDLPHSVKFDVDAREVAALPNPAVPSYVGLDARLGWQATSQLELAVSGQNLAGRHTEFGTLPGAITLGPSVFFNVEWKP